MLENVGAGRMLVITKPKPSTCRKDIWSPEKIKGPHTSVLSSSAHSSNSGNRQRDNDPVTSPDACGSSMSVLPKIRETLFSCAIMKWTMERGSETLLKSFAFRKPVAKLYEINARMCLLKSCVFS